MTHIGQTEVHAWVPKTCLVTRAYYAIVFSIDATSNDICKLFFFFFGWVLMGKFLVHSELGKWNELFQRNTFQPSLLWARKYYGSTKNSWDNNSAFLTNITSIRFLVYWLEHSRNTGCGKEIRKYSPKRTLNTKVQHLPEEYWRETSIQPQNICSGYWKKEGIIFSHSVMLKKSVMFPGQSPSLPKIFSSRRNLTSSYKSGSQWLR